MSPDIEEAVLGELVALRLVVKRLLAYEISRADDPQAFLRVEHREALENVSQVRFSDFSPESADLIRQFADGAIDDLYSGFDFRPEAG